MSDMSEPTTYRNYIAGEWVSSTSGATSENRNPATGELVGLFPRSGQAEVDRGRRGGGAREMLRP